MIYSDKKINHIILKLNAGEIGDPSGPGGTGPGGDTGIGGGGGFGAEGGGGGYDGYDYAADWDYQNFYGMTYPERVKTLRETILEDMPAVKAVKALDPTFGKLVDIGITFSALDRARMKGYRPGMDPAAPGGTIGAEVPMTGIRAGLFEQIGGGGLIGRLTKDFGGAGMDPAELQASYMQEALDYLRTGEMIPQFLRGGAMAQLGGLYGLQLPEEMRRYEIPGREGVPITGEYPAITQEDIISRAIASPLYGALMGGQEAGEEAILRSAAATGGLRSGNVQEALYDYATQLQNRALLEAYQQQLGGLTGLAGLSTMAPQIATQTTEIGRTLAAGEVARQHMEQAQQQQMLSGLLGIASLPLAGGETTVGGELLSGLGGLASKGISAAGEFIGGMFSDRRLKKNIKLIGNVKGHKWYSWAWNVVAEKMGIKGECQGCMADEVFITDPDAVIMKDLFMWVNYSKLGIA